MSKISLGAALALMDQVDDGGQVRTFSVRYIKTDGTAGEKLRCRKGGRAHATTGQSRFRYNIKATGTLQLLDVDTNQPFSLKISLLTHFNSHRIQH